MAEEVLALRNRIIGLLIRDAREQADKTKRECAAALGISTSTITAYEEGRKPISLPQLEVLSYVLDVPVSYFWKKRDPADLVPADEPPLQEVLALRHRIVGALLRQARLDADVSRKELADVLGCSTGTITSYEFGRKPIPLSELELLAQRLRLPLEFFLDEQEGPVGEWNRQQEAFAQFTELSREMQEFVANPTHVKYLEIAVKLSQMPVGGLRAIAEGLLEITY
jgi:transcriptional regulator with XRE-family HTH domain